LRLENEIFGSSISWGLSTKGEKLVFFGFRNGTKGERLTFFPTNIHNSP
jgi:hypothetical protein